MRRREFLAMATLAAPWLAGVLTPDALAADAGAAATRHRHKNPIGHGHLKGGVVVLASTSNMQEVAWRALCLASRRRVLGDGVAVRFMMASELGGFGSADWHSDLKLELESSDVRAIVVVSGEDDSEFAACDKSLWAHDNHLVLIKPSLLHIGTCCFPDSHPIVAVDVGGCLEVRAPRLWNTQHKALLARLQPEFLSSDLLGVGEECDARDRELFTDLVVAVLARVSRAADLRTNLVAHQLGILKTERDFAGDISQAQVVPVA